MGSKTRPAPRKRVDSGESLRRGPNGSAFIKCTACQRDVPVATADMHTCTGDKANRETLARMRDEYMERRKEGEAELAAKKEGKGRKKVDKDPNEPKKPVTAFFIFMEEFREEYKKEYPENKKGSEVTKAGGAKWKEMTEQDKEKYVKEQAVRKENYEKLLADYKAQKSDEKTEADEERVEAEEAEQAAEQDTVPAGGSKKRRLEKKAPSPAANGDEASDESPASLEDDIEDNE